MASHMQPQDCADGCCGEEGTNEPPVGCSEPLDCLQGAYGFKSVFVPPPLAVASSPYGNRNCVNIGVQTISSSQPAVDVAGTYPACSLPLWVPRDMTTPCTRKWVFEDGLTTYTGRQRGCGGEGYELDVTVKRIKVELVAVAIPTGLTGVTINETLEVIGFPSGAGGAGALQIGDTLTLCTKYQRFPTGRLFGEVQINIAGRDIFRTDKDTGISTACGGLLTPTSQLFCNYPDKVYMQFCQDCEWEFWIENCALNWEVTNGYAITIKRVGAHWLGNGGVVHSSTNLTGSFPLEPGQQYLAEVHCSILDVNRLFPYQAGYFQLDPIVHDDCSVACGTNCSDDWGLEQNPAACYPCGCHRGQGIGNELTVTGVPDVLNQFTTCPVVGGNYNWYRWEGYGVLNGSWAWVTRAVLNPSGFYSCEGELLYLGEAKFIQELRWSILGPEVRRSTYFHQLRLVQSGSNGWSIQFREKLVQEVNGVVTSESPWFPWNFLIGNTGPTPPATNEHCGLWIVNNRTVYMVTINPEVCGSDGVNHSGGVTAGILVSRALPAYLSTSTFAAYVENPLCP